jgi:hypothetical protein
MSRYDDDDYDDRDERRRRRRRSQGDEDEYDFRKREPSHSGLGIAACAVGVLALLAAFLALAAGLAADVGFDDIEAAVFEADDPEVILAILLALGAGFLCLVGGALAVAGLIQRNRNKTFAVIGLGLNALLLLGGLMLAIIGALM